MRWEYKDAVIPLGFSGVMYQTYEEHSNMAGAQRYGDRLAEVARQANDAILPVLQRLGRDGWQAEHPTDWPYLLNDLGTAIRSRQE